MGLNIILEEQDEGGYTVYIPSLQGCISQGETKEEALKNIKEALELYLEADENEFWLEFAVDEKIALEEKTGRLIQEAHEITSILIKSRQTLQNK